MKIENLDKLEYKISAKKENKLKSQFNKFKSNLIGFEENYIKFNNVTKLSQEFSQQLKNVDIIIQLIDKNFNFKQNFKLRQQNYEGYFDATACFRDNAQIPTKLWFVYIHLKNIPRVYHQNTSLYESSDIQEVLFYDINAKQIQGFKCKKPIIIHKKYNATVYKEDYLHPNFKNSYYDK